MIIKIRPQSPFNFELSAIIFSDGDPQIQKYENGIYWQVININKHLFLIEVQSLGSVDEPELSVTIKPDNELSKGDIELVRDEVISIFNLNSNLKDFYDYIKNENVLSKLILKLKGLNSPTTPTFFEAIVTSIIEQQISLKAARSIETKMVKKYGEKLKIKPKTYYLFPTPETISKLKKQDLRDVGLSFRKAEYVIGLSKNIKEGKIDLNSLKTQETSEIIQQLMKIRGIGVWTAELAVIRGLHRMVALPADDIGLRRVVSHYYTGGKPITSHQLRTIAKNWGNWSGLVVFYLIIADLMSIKI
ncbi:DNA-3-methyladenine glycosylase family protein [Methanobacterium spitsbergense]|uniref:DNA-3-methyladenine glycosylase n=1 Tax=Methanobacterium spitsbergense TaxID=2874285 RepID=A0A8T5V1Z0_9EURY|nr:DNA-3-methyladenine glycosylase [Methanobacterium spitsbergense]MBZ2165695.1 DNA-3-methyladenine glycosylase [Methanobacterium spitsbergense]